MHIDAAAAVLDAVFVAHAKDHEGLPPPMLAEVAFGGRSNVGKSSLINKLVNRRKLVRTSSTPGATRGLSLFRATLRLPPSETALRDAKGGDPAQRAAAAKGERAQVDLVDLPGYGFAQRSKSERKSWGPMIEGYLEKRVSLRVLVLLVDVRRGLEEDDAQLLEYLAHVKRTSIVAITKIDKLGRNDRDKGIRAIAADVKKASHGHRVPVQVIATSADTGEGIDALWSAIRTHAFLGAP
ncbi:MAG: GTP-binding protein [Deltaproteobacteria bacterium]